MSANPVAGNASFTQVFTIPNQLPSVNTADLVTTNLASTSDGKIAFFGAPGLTAATRQTANQAAAQGGAYVQADVQSIADLANTLRSALLVLGVVV